ncbi:MAG: hypothetical protein R3F20_13035 [Planctomycetota bacterium]
MRRIPALIALAAMLLLPALAFGQGAPITIGGPLDDTTGGPLLAGQVYHVTTSVTVPAGMTLTAQPGAIIKLTTSAGFTVNGTFLCGGPGMPTFITALTDDTVGGDSNGDGAGTSPTAGTWGSLSFNSGSGASALVNTTIRYGGRFGATQLILSSAPVTIDGCTISNSQATGLGVSGAAPAVTNTTFANCGTNAATAAHFSNLAGFSGNTAANCGLNHVLVTGAPIPNGQSVTVSAASQINGAHVMTASFTISAGGSLTLDAGVALKLPTSFAIACQGVLTANGTAGSPVVLTAFTDDTVGGDSNNDGAATLPTPGHWSGINFDGPGAAASALTWTELRYGGRFGSPTVNLQNNGADITLQSCTFLAGLGTSAFDGSAGSQATMDGCDFLNNSGIAVTNVTWPQIQSLTNNTASGNGGNYIRVNSATIPGSAVIAPVNMIGGAFVPAAGQTLPAGETLTFASGCVVKWPSAAQLIVDGTLVVNASAGAPVVMTSINDDAVGGDTDNDGAMTPALLGDWTGIRINAGGTGSALTGLRIAYAGRFSTPALSLFAANPVVTDCTVDHCLAAGMSLNATSFPTVTGCSFNDNGGQAVAGVRITAVPGFMNCSASSNAGGDYIAIGGQSCDQDTTIAPVNLIGPALVATVNVTVDLGATLTLAAGVIVKMPISGQFNVNGVLDGLGTPANPVVLTSILDDAFGGDTNLDGPSTGNVGDWTSVDFFNPTDESSLDRVIVRYAGRFGSPAVNCAGGSPFLNTCTIESSQAAAMQLSATARPTVVGSHFAGNASLISGLSFPALQGFRENTASGNTAGDQFRIGIVGVGEFAQIFPYNYPNGALINGGTVIGAGGHLILEAGVVLKFEQSASLSNSAGVFQALGTAFDPVVLTSLDDDSIGGDSNGNGPSVGSVGFWTTLSVSSPVPGSILEHVEIGYAGRFGNPSVNANTAIRIRQVLVHHGQSDGFLLAAADGDVWNAIAWANGGDGFDVGANGPGLVHCNAVGNTLVGFRAAGAWTGSLVSSIATGNGTDVFGITVGNIFASDIVGDPSVVGTNGNISADPLFADAANGDFELTATSPCLGMGDLAQANLVVLDFKERSRRVDHDLMSGDLPDIGALERATFSLSFTGEPRLGTTMTFQVDGAIAGSAVLGFGSFDAFEYCPTVGFITIGTVPNITVFAMTSTGAPVAAAMPTDPALEGIRFGVQAVALSLADPTTGNPTERFRGRLFN